jgi:uncharacterized protein
MSLKKIAFAASVALAAQAHAQSLPTTGTLVIVPAYGEVTHVNDEATASFMIEEQHKDKTIAATRVNEKMKQGTEIARKADGSATLKTLGYYTYPVYPDPVLQPPQPMSAEGIPTPPKPPAPVAWRVGQYLEVKTTNIANLPKTTAAVQKVLALNGINFGLSPATTKKLDDQRIAATYKNLNERIASIASAMGRKVSDSTLETVDFEASGAYAGNQQADAGGAPMMMRSMGKREEAQVSEPSFEPGESTLQMRVVGKVKFK